MSIYNPLDEPKDVREGMHSTWAEAKQWEEWATWRGVKGVHNANGVRRIMADAEETYPLPLLLKVNFLTLLDGALSHLSPISNFYE